MTKEFEDRGTTYSIHENVNIGEVKVADEVVAIIAGLAATEIEGVDSLGGNITNEIVSKLGMKNLSKGVTVTVNESRVLVDITLNLKYGTQIPEVSAKVQEKVKSAIETMTGLQVTEVNIKVASVAKVRDSDPEEDIKKLESQMEEEQDVGTVEEVLDDENTDSTDITES